jgi:hypothetical protein
MVTIQVLRRFKRLKTKGGRRKAKGGRRKEYKFELQVVSSSGSAVAFLRFALRSAKGPVDLSG